MVVEELKKRKKIKVEIIHVGNKKIRGCIACYRCAKKIRMKNAQLMMRLINGFKKNKRI